MVNKRKVLSIAMQAGLLKSMFPNSTVINIHDRELIWKHKIKPSPLSAEYTVKLHYKISGKVGGPVKRPNFYVTDPMPLPLARDAKRLPHVYDQKKQRLCLYYPDGIQWNSSMLLAHTVVWWGFEWLYHYELWLRNNDWKGGGVHPSKNEVKREDNRGRNQPNN